MPSWMITPHQRATAPASLLVLVIIFLITVIPVNARDLLQGDLCTVGPEQAVNGNLFVVCRTLVVEGIVRGDVFGVAGTATITGTVEGSVYLAGGRLDMRGSAGDDLHFIGPVLYVRPDAQFTSAEGDLYSFTLSTRIEGVDIPGSVVGGGYQLLIESDVGEEVSFWGSTLRLSANVAGDVDASVGAPGSSGIPELRALLSAIEPDVELVEPGLVITESSRVGGQITYTAPAEGSILSTQPNPPIFIPFEQPSPVLDAENPIEGFGNYLSQVAREFVTLALIGAFALILAPRGLQAPLPTIRNRTLPSLGVGLLAFVLSFPVFLIILVFSALIVGLVSLLALSELTLATTVIFGVLFFSSASLYYFIAIFVSRAIICLLIGRVVLRLARRHLHGMLGLLISMLIGVAFLAFFASLPIVGVVINAVTAFLGLGGLFTMAQEQIERNRMPQPAPVDTTLAVVSGETPPLPPPPADEDEAPRGPGTDNLPEGFKWWT